MIGLAVTWSVTFDDVDDDVDTSRFKDNNNLKNDTLLATYFQVTRKV